MSCFNPVGVGLYATLEQKKTGKPKLKVCLRFELRETYIDNVVIR